MISDVDAATVFKPLSYLAKFKEGWSGSKIKNAYRYTPGAFRTAEFLNLATGVCVLLLENHVKICTSYQEDFDEAMELLDPYVEEPEAVTNPADVHQHRVMCYLKARCLRPGHPAIADDYKGKQYYLDSTSYFGETRPLGQPKTPNDAKVIAHWHLPRERGITQPE